MQKEKNAGRITKCIVLILIAVAIVIAGVLETPFIVWDIKEYGMQSYDAMEIIFLPGALAIVIIEMLRLKNGKKFILLPMLLMLTEAFLFALAAGFFYENMFLDYADARAAWIGSSVLFVIVMMAAFGIRALSKKEKKPKKTNSDGINLDVSFGGFNAEWFWDEVSETYLRMKGLWEEDEESVDKALNEHSDEIYTYACNYFAYLFVWLYRRKALSIKFIELVKNDTQLPCFARMNGNPGKWLYETLDGKFKDKDVGNDSYLCFLNDYYDEHDIRGNLRETCFRNDYDEVVCDSLEGGIVNYWCCDFSWEKYALLEERLDKRYKEYLLKYPCEWEWLITQPEKVYSETFKQEFEIKVQPVEYPFQQTMDEYVKRCREHLMAFPAELIAKISDKFIEEWGADWCDGLLPDGSINDKAEAFTKSISSGDISIYRPRGEEIAYSLQFEATFETEHGISIGIKGDEVVYLAYSMDQESPWECSQDGRYQEGM